MNHPESSQPAKPPAAPPAQAPAAKAEPARRKRALGVGIGVVLGLAASASAFAVDGCKVLLCLAAPAGWRSIPACVSVMEEALGSIFSGLPSCHMVGDPTTGTGSYAKVLPSNYYSDCPTGTTALPLGQYAIQSATWDASDNTTSWVAQQTMYSGIGDGATITPLSGDTSSSLPPKICVSGQALGTVNYALGVDSDSTILTVPVYASVTILQPNTTSNVIGVYIDGALYNQVRY